MKNLNWRKNYHVTIAQAFFLFFFVDFALNIIVIASSKKVKITLKKTVIIDILLIHKLKISFIVYPFIEEVKSFLYFSTYVFSLFYKFFYIPQKHVTPGLCDLSFVLSTFTYYEMLLMNANIIKTQCAEN